MVCKLIYNVFLFGLNEWKMVFNVDKCKTMSISRKKLTVDVTYTMKEQSWTMSERLKTLGSLFLMI